MYDNSRFQLPKIETPDSILKLFFERVAGEEEVWINREPLLITVNYKITDEKITDQELIRYGISSKQHAMQNPKLKARERITPEKKNLYTQSPVLEINNIQSFKKALYGYIEVYVNSNIAWTKPDIARSWEDVALYAMSTIWTDATRQDFTNPEQFFNRYTAFLTQNQWRDLRQGQEVGVYGNSKIWKTVSQSTEERETPYNYALYVEDTDGRRSYFPSVSFGVQNNKVYVYAIQNIYNKNLVENEDVQKLRNQIKGRGIEPLSIATLISFLDEAKKRGIKQVVMPDNFIMQYTTKNKIREQFIEGIIHHTKPEDRLAQIRKMRKEKEEKLNKDYAGSMDKRLIALMHVNKYYSTGLKFIEYPGEVSDNLTVDIQDFKIGRKQPEKSIDRRNQKRENKEEGR